MIGRTPAYSSAFSPESLPEVPTILPIEKITPQWAWGGSRGQGVKVAVIDSGIESNHPGIEGPPVAGHVAITGASDGALAYDFSPHPDSFGHGTACADLIRSIAPECELYSVRVLGPNSGGSGAAFAAGLRWAIDNGIQVCNLSLGTTKKDFFGILHELADLAYFENVMLVSAANNMPIPSFPSVYGSVISVACHELKDPYILYYNPNPPVEFAAPGIDLRVPWRGGEWRTTSGNSFAAPHVTGLIARILSKHPGIRVFEMKSVLRSLAANSGSGGQGMTADKDVDPQRRSCPS